METLTASKFRFSDFELDCSRRVLTRGGEPLILNSKTFDLLCELVENRGKLMSKDELLQRVWPGQFVEENNLTVQISALRKVFGEKKGGPSFITTVTGKGYSFVAQVDADAASEITIENHQFSRVVIEEFSDAQQEKLTAPEKNRYGFGRRKQNYLPSAGFVLIVAVLGGAGYFWQYGKAAKTAAPFQQISIKKLTTSGKISNAAISPDGKLFAYSLNGLNSLWLGHTSGGEPIELRPPADINYRSLRFSRDSTALYYVATGGDMPKGSLFRLPVFGGVPEKLRDDVKTNISFAPDMNGFAFVGDDRKSGVSSLMIAETNGTDEREIARRPLKSGFESSTPAWSPDGKTIAVSAVNELENGMNYEVFTVSTADGQIKPLTSQKFRLITSLAWLDDGSGLIMIASELSQADRQLLYVSYPAGEIRQINPDLNNYGTALGISTDSGSLLTVQTEYLANIWLAPTENFAEARQITFSSIGGRYGRHGLEWTTDNRLVYVAFADRGMSLWAMDPDGSNQKRITPDGFIDYNPSATADGRTIAFGSNRSGSFEVWRVSADGSDLRQLTFDGGEMPGVSPDGKWVVYVSTRDGLNNVRRVPLDGGEAVRLTDKPAQWIRVSPDSRSFACGYLDGHGKTRLAVFPIDGGEPVKLFDLPPTANLRYTLRWTPDGNTLSYRDWENGYWRQSLAGGSARRIENLPEEKYFSAAWSPDGKRLAFVRGQEIRDVVLLQSVAK